MHEQEREQQRIAALTTTLLHAPDSFSRVHAAGYLASLSQPPATAFAALVAALGNVDQEVQVAAARALGSYGPRAVDHLLPLLAGDPYLAMAAAEGLGQIGDERAVAPLALALQAAHAYHYDIAGALAQIGPPAVPALRRLLAVPDVEVRHWAGRALQDIISKHPILSVGMEDES